MYTVLAESAAVHGVPTPEAELVFHFQEVNDTHTE